MLWLLKLTSPLVLVIRQGKLSTAKGRVPALARRELLELLEEAEVNWGRLHADGPGRIHFSSTIPEKLHQRLRNLLVTF